MTIYDEHLNKILSNFREDNVYRSTDVRFDNITPAQWRKRVDEARKLMYVKLNEVYNSIEKSLYKFDQEISCNIANVIETMNDSSSKVNESPVEAQEPKAQPESMGGAHANMVGWPGNFPGKDIK